jgi:sulfatase maturation enzyme AslB (radical SAM superfamily)
MLDLISELRDLEVRSISWTGGGEPTLHPSFHKFVKQAYIKRIRQGLFTNANKDVKYDPSKLDWVRVSKTNFPWNITNLKYLRSCLTLGMCLNYRGGKDDKDIQEALAVAEEVKADYVQVRPALKVKGKSKKVDIPKIEHPLLKLTDYKFVGVDEKRIYELCEGFHFEPFIWQDGDVDVCGYHRKEKEFNLGNLYEKSFREIMEKSPKYVPVISNCQVCCKLNSINSTIHRVRNLEDVDFP